MASRFQFLSVALFSCFAGAVSNACAGTIEVVQSVPLETSLTVPGIRQTQEVWLEMVNAAKVSIDLEQFYISEKAGEALSPVLTAIEKAASRGVRVRIIVDSKFYKTYPESVDRLGTQPNCEKRIIDFSPTNGVQHAKFFVVDGKDAFLGSQNFDWRALSHIHEIGLRLSDAEAVDRLERIFTADWVMAGSKVPAAAGDGNASDLGTVRDGIYASPKQLNPKDVPDSISAIVTLMNTARTSVEIQVMEFSTRSAPSPTASWKVLEDAIRKAGQRGVKVRLLVDVSNLRKARADLERLASYSNVEVRTMTIPAWSGGAIDYARLVHSKYLVIDGTASAWVGTENWSEGYFTHSRDVGYVTHESDPVGKLEQIFTHAWTSAYASKL